MARLQTIWSILASEKGHGMPFLGVLPAAAGAVVLGIAVAADTDWLAIAGGIVLAVGIVGTALANHVGVEYEIYSRLNKLEGNE